MKNLASERAPTARLLMRGVSKSFGKVEALSGVDLLVQAGEIHALLGENGAGKSTLMKILSGAHQESAGTIELDGLPYRPGSPVEARRAGVAMIYQELALALDLSVEENIVLGLEPRRLGLVDRRRRRALAENALARLGEGAPRPEQRVRDLGPGPRQLVEIARALAQEARVIVFDEPTSSLSRADAERLFEVVRRLAALGTSVIWISHFMEEVSEIAERFTVLRDGKSVGSGRVSETKVSDWVALMAGRTIEEFFPPRHPRITGPLLQIKTAGVPCSLRRGEILGLAGLVGAGRTELLRAIFGLEGAAEVELEGGTGLTGSPAARMKAGLGLASEDRKEEGLALAQSIAFNLTLARPVASKGILRPREEAAVVDRWTRELSLRCTSGHQKVGELSGGNQQKVVLARLLHQGAEILLLDEPTRGVDVGAKVEIYRLLDRLAHEGKAIILSSSYFPELLGVCDRIAVMHRGRLGPARPVQEWTEHSLLKAAARGEGDAA